VINYYWVRSPSKSPRSSSCPKHGLVISAEGIQKYVRQLLAAQCSEMCSGNQEWNSSEETFSFANKKNHNSANEAISKDVQMPFFSPWNTEALCRICYVERHTVMVQRSTCPVEGLVYLHEHGPSDPRFWKRRFVTISNILHFSTERCVCFWAVTERRKYTKYSFNITSTQTIK